MPTPSPRTGPAAPPAGADAANQPWLLFFRRVRVLAAELDALEAARNGTDEK